jgi:hypothetical protein
MTDRLQEPRPFTWLDPLPIRWDAGANLFRLQPPNDDAPAPAPIETTFEQITNEVHHPRHRIPRRIPEVRRALCSILRFAHHPDLIGRGTWVPEAPCYKPFRSTITPLLDHPLWQGHAVIAAPFLVFLPRRPIAGIIDAIVQHPEGEIGIVALQTCRREEHLVSAARTELGGLIAALADHQRLWVTHAITLWAAPGSTEVEHHHPDICLSHWVDAIDLHGFGARLKPRTLGNAAAPDPSADPAELR